MAKTLFQKRHYDFFAQLLRTIKFIDGYDDMIIKFAVAFAKDNPDFDSDRFLAAVYRADKN